MAALTIPGLIVKNQEKEKVVQLKKAYNVFSNAFQTATIQYGPIEDWGWETDELAGSINAIDKIAPFLNFAKRCDGTKGCYPKNVMYKNLDGSNWLLIDDLAYNSKVMLRDGMLFYIWNNRTKCTSEWGCGTLCVDINGAKGPNQKAIDQFEFYITKKGIIPRGGPDDKETPLTSNCRGGTNYGCTAWVLIKENMDYLRKPVSWDE